MQQESAPNFLRHWFLVPLVKDFSQDTFGAMQKYM